MATDRPLNERQLRFVEEYQRDFNATQAYIRAGYAPRGAQPSSAALLADPRIQHALSARRDEVRKAREDSTVVTVDWIEKRLARIAGFNLCDLLNDDGTIKNPKTLSPDDQYALSGLQVDEIYQTIDGKRQAVGTRWKVKTRSAERCLHLLAQIKGMLADRADDNPLVEQISLESINVVVNLAEPTALAAARDLFADNPDQLAVLSDRTLHPDGAARSAEEAGVP